ncbi:3-hydroxyacyl-CoA dehydrogenase NAD-binding domain-containing protein [Eisenibacter elegans]|uniref:3-hydroxyacyl-CoA dehydrogenase NAD-binding domain-containing protein n=1 Tax=Eisenibacter elegans TaxID=997 RepID=UPI0004038778|nr:3-hydroxyacyl-CoA dehydrogenase NAD-binding domain-containing protein [Eisenibacter elegans]
MINYAVDNGIAVIAWNMEGYPQNVLNEDSMAAFEQNIDKALADAAVKGIIIASEKESFVAGADLKMLRSMLEQDSNAVTAEQAFKTSLRLNLILRKYEAGGKPVVAAINGHALGGGFEICLASHYRVAIDNPKTKIGLPESKIGLLPGAGGTQRLPRLIGIEKAAPMLLEGKELSPQEALKLGIIDELVSDRAALIAAARKWIEANQGFIQPWDENKKGKIVGRSNYKVPGGNIQSPRGAQLMLPGTALLMGKTYGNYPAQLAIMKAVYEGLQVPIELALEIESRHFTTLLMGPVAKNMIRTLFFGIGDANKGEARPKDVPKTDTKKVGILGAGMMGAGIAYVSALAGIEVVLKDVSVEAAEKGKDYSRELLKKRVSRGKMTQEAADQVLALIKTSADAADLKGSDLIIEAVFENRELKAAVTKEAEAQLAETAVFGSNTSTLPISGLAEASARPKNFIGIHFFSPVDKMPLVEIIMGKETSDYALAVAIDYTMKIRKTPVVVNDSRGFYTSRCFGTYTSEGIEMVSEGIHPQLVESAGKMAGMPVGPLDVADAVAIDLAYKVMKQTEADTGEKIENIPSGKVVKKFVEELERFGKKNKKGFYEYPDGGKKFLWPGLAELYPVKAEQPSLEYVKRRILHRQAIEAVRCLEEGVVRNPTDADVGSILAWGFAPYTGGVLSYIDMVGVAQFVKECDELADQCGERFRPTERLREMAKNGETFHGSKAKAVA